MRIKGRKSIHVKGLMTQSKKQKNISIEILMIFITIYIV